MTLVGHLPWARSAPMLAGVAVLAVPVGLAAGLLPSSGGPADAPGAGSTTSATGTPSPTGSTPPGTPSPTGSSRPSTPSPSLDVATCTTDTLTEQGPQPAQVTIAPGGCVAFRNTTTDVVSVKILSDTLQLNSPDPVGYAPPATAGASCPFVVTYGTGQPPVTKDGMILVATPPPPTPSPGDSSTPPTTAPSTPSTDTPTATPPTDTPTATPPTDTPTATPPTDTPTATPPTSAPPTTGNPGPTGGPTPTETTTSPPASVVPTQPAPSPGAGGGAGLGIAGTGSRPAPAAISRPAGDTAGAVKAPAGPAGAMDLATTGFPWLPAGFGAEPSMTTANSALGGLRAPDPLVAPGLVSRPGWQRPASAADQPSGRASVRQLISARQAADGSTSTGSSSPLLAVLMIVIAVLAAIGAGFFRWVALPPGRHRR